MRVFEFVIRGFSPATDPQGREPAGDSRGPGITIVVVAAVLFLITELRPNLAVPAAPAFPPQVTGSSSPVATLLFQNRGGADLRIEQVSLAGEQSGDFALDDALLQGACSGRNLAPGQSCVVGIRFEPSAEGPRAAQLILRDSAPGNPHQVALVGFGLPRPPNPQPELAVYPRDFDFGGREAESQNELPVLLVNEGDAPLRVGNAGFVQPDPAWSFQPADCLDAELGPNAACRALVTFTPKQRAAYQAQLNIPSSAGDMTIALRGEGLPRHGYCCFSGKPAKLDEESCRMQNGTFFTEVAELRAQCKPADRTPPNMPTGLRPGDVKDFVSAWPCNPAALTWDVVHDQSEPVTYHVILQAYNPRMAARGGDPWVTLREDAEVHENFVNATPFVNPVAGARGNKADSKRTAILGRVVVNQPTQFRWQVSARDAAGNESAPATWHAFSCAQPPIG